MDNNEFEKAQKKQIEAMNDIARNSMQCCMPKHSLCDKCRKVLVCPMMQISIRENCELYEKLPNPLDEIVTETRSLNPIKEEIKMEVSEMIEKEQAEIAKNAWKVRLKEEYAQLKERYEKITKYKNIQEVELNLADKAQTAIEHYRYRLLDQQMRAMGGYLHILELRAVLESIDLN